MSMIYVFFCSHSNDKTGAIPMKGGKKINNKKIYNNNKIFHQKIDQTAPEGA